MKKTIILLGLILAFGWLSAQSVYYDGLKEALLDTVGDAKFKHFMRQEFSRSTHTNGNGTLGNFVGFSTNDNNLSFAYSWVRESNVFEINAAGGVNEGITKLVSNNKFNSGVKTGFRYSRLLCTEKLILDYGKDKDLRREYEKLGNDYELYRLEGKAKKTKELQKAEKKSKTALDSLVNVKKVLDSLDKQEGLKIFSKKLDSTYREAKQLLQLEIDYWKAKLQNKDSLVVKALRARQVEYDKISKPLPFQIVEKKLGDEKTKLLPLQWHDSLKVKEKVMEGLEKKIKANKFTSAKMKARQEKVAIEIEVATLKYSADTLKSSDHGKSALRKKGNETAEKRRGVLDKFAKMKPEDLSIWWYSISGNVESTSFRTFDPDLEPSDQIQKEQDYIPSLTASITRSINVESSNRPNPGARKIRIWSLGFSLKYGNNLSDLSQVEIETRDTVSSGRSLVNKVTAYKGDLKSGFASGSLFWDFYQFFGNVNNVGFHIRATSLLGPHAPITSIRGGLLFAALKQGDYKSLVNFELFYGLNNIFAAGKEDNLLSRNVFGIQTTFPFQFNLKK